ncbi:conserved hypothetical protein [Talaromyces stipitatus ATCC 10500]|uniref:Uncharacterized protein n=1 Tax=Talaromyces stipitatus (strain ATCC 10500 / CBS 375.48 / QM 6759 / NRRL 1006) TaxID=441959 RepID=B8M284_TALSN|nr:uncharacterized protein TSTA_087840 [Talaromyces stipitatus ATCC 10500]EED21548.1 conserved hypothetical protein [Talaromyces stipitatus ATCC 10500]
MRLRETIRAPSRYEDECELSPGVSRRRLPRRRRGMAEERCIPYVDFNPNLPPAAFPTLDHPRPAGQGPPSFTQPEPSHVPSSSTSSSSSDDADNAGSVADRHHLDAFKLYCRDIPPEELDNFVASNGPQNPQYRRNMALLAREESSDLEISEDDDDQRWVVREEQMPEDPQWHDLPISLQIEIAENMLEHHMLSTVQLLLGLNQDDIEQLTCNLQRHNEDLEYENLVLEEMRAKQLEALMCLDNSDLKKHAVPARLVMASKLWNRAHRVIRKRSKWRYLLCQVGDLLLARKFLSKRGLSMIYAGEWDNQFVAVPSLSNTTGVPETMEWKGAREPPPDPINAAGNDGLLSNNTPRSSTAGRSNVQIAPPSTVTDQRGEQSTAEQGHDSRTLENDQQASSNRHDRELFLPNQALVRLRIGPRNAARIHVEQTTQPFTPPRRHKGPSPSASPRPQSIVTEANSDDTIEEPPSEWNTSDELHNQYPMPVLRRIGSWSTDRTHPQPSEHSNSTRSLSGSFDNSMHHGPSAVQPRAYQFNQPNTRDTHDPFTIDAAGSINSSPPRSSDLPSRMEGIVYENARAPSVRNTIPTPAASSPTCMTTTNRTVDKNQAGSLTVNPEMYLATPKSYRTVARDTQFQSNISAHQNSSFALIDEAQSKSPLYSMPPFSLKSHGEVTQTDTDELAASNAMQVLRLLSPIKVAKGNTDEASEVVADQPKPVTSTKMANEVRQEVTDPLSMKQQRKSVKYTNPLFGFDSFEVYADNQAPQDVNTSHADPQGTVTTPSTNPFGSENSGVADSSKTQVEISCANEPENVDANQAVARDVPSDHLSPISGNAPVETSPSPRKTRQSTNKEHLASIKRDPSAELKNAQPKRNKNTDSTTSPPQRATRGRGRPRKNKA